MLLPLQAALVQPALEGFQRFRPDLAGAHPALFLRGTELASLEQLDMLNDGGEGHAERPGDLAHRLGAGSQLLDDGAAGGVREGVESTVELG